MSSPPKVVLCVREGTWGALPQESAVRYLETCIVEPLQRARQRDLDTKEETPAACVEVMDTLEQAKERLTRGGVDVLVLNSRSMIGEARSLKKQYPRVQVMVLTGLIPQDEVVLVAKDWLQGEGLIKIILHTSQGM